MITDTDQITTNKLPFYSLTIKDNEVVACVHDATIPCWQSECMFKKSCRMENK